MRDNRIFSYSFFAQSIDPFLSKSHVDNLFSIFNVDDNTKILDFDISNLTTATTRTITMADFDVDLAGLVPYTGATTTVDLGSQDFTTLGNVGIGVPAHVSYNLNLQGSGLDDIQLRFSSNDTNNTTQVGGFTLRHFAKAQKDVAFFVGASVSSTLAFLNFGGGSNNFGSATQLQFLTSVSSTSTMGTIRYIINGVGDHDFKAGNMKTTGTIYINTNSATALLVEDNGLNDDVFVVNTNTAAVSMIADISLLSNSKKFFLGANQESSIYFDGTDLNITLNDPGQAGVIKLTDNVEMSGQIDMNANVITDLAGLHFNTATDLTIDSGGEVTLTQGHHSIDTFGAAANDDLDTIIGGNNGEILLILPKDDNRTVRIRNAVGNIFLKHQVESKSFSFTSPAGVGGTFYSAGFYSWSAIDENLTQASLSVTHSAANSASACHIGIVAGGAGVVDTGVVKITVSGTTINDEGNRAGSQTVDLVADITLLVTDQYVETTQKWIGEVTIALEVASGSPVNFNVDINYGCSKYEDFGNQAFTINVLEVVGIAGGNDSGFNLRLFHHSSAGWTYASTGFVAGGTVLANMNTDYSPEQNLVSGESFAYKRTDLNTDVAGSGSEGLVLEITTSGTKSIEIMDIHLGVHTAPNFAYMATTKQHLMFMKHGPNWLEL